MEGMRCLQYKVGGIGEGWEGRCPNKEIEGREWREVDPLLNCLGGRNGADASEEILQNNDL